MIKRIRNQWKRHRTAAKLAYAHQRADLRDELRKVALGGVTPMTRAAEQAAITALVLAATGLMGIASHFVPMSDPASPHLHERLALLGWWGATSYSVFHLLGVWLQIRRLGDLSVDRRVITAHLNTCVGTAHPLIFATVFVLSLIMAFMTGDALGSDRHAFVWVALPSIAGMVIAILLSREAAPGRQQIQADIAEARTLLGDEERDSSPKRTQGTEHPAAKPADA